MGQQEHCVPSFTEPSVTKENGGSPNNNVIIFLKVTRGLLTQAKCPCFFHQVDYLLEEISSGIVTGSHHLWKLQSKTGNRGSPNAY